MNYITFREYSGVVAVEGLHQMYKLSLVDGGAFQLHCQKRDGPVAEGGVLFRGHEVLLLRFQGGHELTQTLVIHEELFDVGEIIGGEGFLVIVLGNDLLIGDKPIPEFHEVP